MKYFPNKKSKNYTLLITTGIIFMLILAGILFFISFENYNPEENNLFDFPRLCGNGILDQGESCDYAATDEVNNPYGDVCSTFCRVDGTFGEGAWDGCRGNGAAVCTDHPNVTNQYFIDHPKCKPNDTCAGSFFACNVVICPEP